jgi:glutathione synthase/RimK-type ligase-like ATP-grasp enzyme
MTTVWIIGHTFDGWDNWKEHVQFNLLAKGFLDRNCEVKFVTLDKLKIYENSKLICYDDEVFEIPNIIVLKTYIQSEVWKRKFSYLQSIGCFIVNPPKNAIDYDNKVNIYQKAKECNIPIPKTLFVPYTHCDDHMLKRIDEEIGWPCIIKPNRSWFSVGLTVVNSREDMANAIKISHQSYKENFGNFGVNPTHFIVQEIVNAECMVAAIAIGPKVYTSIFHGSRVSLRKTTFRNDDSYQKYKFLIVPFDPPNDLVQLVTKVRTSFGLNMMRSEFFLTKNGYVLCETNTTTSFGWTSLIPRINLADEIAEYVIDLYQTSMK